MAKKQEFTELQKFEWDHYTKHFEYLRSEKHNIENGYSQLLVYLNSGIFIVSSVISTMYDKVAYKGLIVISWWIAAFSLICILLSFTFSIKSFKETIDLWKDKKENLNSCYNNYTKNSIILSTYSLFIAIFFTLLFFTLNFLFMSENKAQNFVDKISVNIQKNSEPVSATISPEEFFAQTGTKTK